ncbi:MAG: glutamine amidotransferase [Candidatus Krumholzibacteriia bacterium]
MSYRKLMVLLAGESWVTHTTHIKGVDYFVQSGYGEGIRWIKGAIEGGGHEFFHIPNHLASEQFPVCMDELRPFDVLILSDIGANTLLLHPSTTAHSIVTCNRLKLIRDYVEEGGSLLMVGGYMSYQGIEGKARYCGTPIEDALPVIMRETDDRVEVPEGFEPEVVIENEHHQIVDGLPHTFPVMLFYNRVVAKPDSTVLLRNGRDPILTAWSYGKGRAAAFTPDAAPHGATPEFLEWEHFDSFWLRVIEWLTEL